MKNNLYFVYDEDGYFIGDSLTKEENSVDVRPQQPCWKPKWNGTEWIETATEEEMNPPIVKPSPTVQERVDCLEDELLTTQVALAEQYEANLAINEELTNTQTALTEIFEMIGGV